MRKPVLALTYRRISLLVLAAFLLVLLLVGYVVTNGSHHNARVVGKVTICGGVVSRPCQVVKDGSVSVMDSKGHLVAEEALVGAFSFRLTPGLYSLVVETTFGDRRLRVKAIAGKTTVANVRFDIF